MDLKFAAETHPGKIRKVNEDSFGILENLKLFFICDGMGGHRAGNFASKTAVEFISKLLAKLNDNSTNYSRRIRQLAQKLDIVLQLGHNQNLATKIVICLRLTNRLLYQFANKFSKLEGMGTTFAGVMFDENNNIAHILHIGDSRVYRLRPGMNPILEQLTEDHSKINELIKAGKITKEEAQRTELKSMITRALGTNKKIKIDYRIEPVKDNDYFLLCSDGLTNELEDESIMKIFLSATDDLNSITQMLIKSANDYGGRDNITVIVIKVCSIRRYHFPTRKIDETPAVEIVNNTIFNSISFTIDEETDEELHYEDKLLKVLLRKIPVKIQKELKYKVLFHQPLFIAFVVTVLTISTWIGFRKILYRKNFTERTNAFTTKITGIRIETEMPTETQLSIYRNSPVKEILASNWQAGNREFVKEVKGIEVYLIKQDTGKKKFIGLTPVEVTGLVPGIYDIQLNWKGRNYKIRDSDEKQLKDVTIEPSGTITKKVVILIPIE